MESRTHGRTIAPDESAELEQLVFELVRERLLKAVGAGGMWTLQFRANTDTDSLFGETISEFIARDIADQLAAPSAEIEKPDASAEVAETDAEDDIDPVEPTVWIDVPMPAEAETETVIEPAAEVVAPDEVTVEFVEADEHRMFKPRKAA